MAAVSELDILIFVYIHFILYKERFAISEVIESSTLPNNYYKLIIWTYYAYRKNGTKSCNYAANYLQNAGCTKRGICIVGLFDEIPYDDVVEP